MTERVTYRLLDVRDDHQVGVLQRRDPNVTAGDAVTPSDGRVAAVLRRTKPPPKSDLHAVLAVHVIKQHSA